MIITINPEIERRLIEQAGRLGEDANRLAEKLIAEGLLDDHSLDDPDNLTDEQIAEIRAGIKRGLEAVAEGRVKPIAQVVAEVRRRHGFPASWASGIYSPKTMR